MPEWIPTRASAKGRLVLAALDLFAAADYDEVGVGDLSSAAGVTTGSLYHHFGSKLGLYDVVRYDIERRVLDRLQGAVAARRGDRSDEAAYAALLVAFDFLVDQGFARLLAVPHPDRASDPIDTYIDEVAGGDGLPIGPLLVAVWRAGLRSVLDGVPVDRARSALTAVRIDPPSEDP